MKASWDIFCSVVDNYGDIGVTWRLARQLVAEHGQSVRLWVDDLQAFARLCPQADAAAASQWHAGVEVCAWPRTWLPVPPADVVIEAFACELPQDYRQAMAQRSRQSMWLNLEYLSAEDWVAGCHGLPSPQAGGLRKFFFFPGFTPDTGGLLRERELLAARDAFQTDALAQREFLSRLGVEAEGAGRLISLFCYENAGLGEWLDALAGADETVLLLVPEGRVLADLQRWADRAAPLQVGERIERGALRLQILPFVSQQDYDRLLWSCDFNLVRGEDSLLRGLWAGRPLLWDIYKQADGAHEDKLAAFAEIHLVGLPPVVAQALQHFWQCWNAGAGCAQAWLALQAWQEELREHARLRSASLGAQTDLAARLVQFCSDWL